MIPSRCPHHTAQVWRSHRSGFAVVPTRLFSFRAIRSEWVSSTISLLLVSCNCTVTQLSEMGGRQIDCGADCRVPLCTHLGLGPSRSVYGTAGPDVRAPAEDTGAAAAARPPHCRNSSRNRCSPASEYSAYYSRRQQRDRYGRARSPPQTQRDQSLDVGGSGHSDGGTGPRRLCPLHCFACKRSRRGHLRVQHGAIGAPHCPSSLGDGLI